MLNLYFGDFWSILSTLFLVLVLAFIAVTCIKYKKIQYWGRQILILAALGLLLCIFVVMRDDYAAYVQTGSGIIPDFQIYLAYAGAALAAFSTISALFVKSQKYRRVMFFILSAAIIFKAAVIEIARLAV